jgi:hypothetical protein
LGNAPVSELPFAWFAIAIAIHFGIRTIRDKEFCFFVGIHFGTVLPAVAGEYAFPFPIDMPR